MRVWGSVGGREGGREGRCALRAGRPLEVSSRGREQPAGGRSTETRQRRGGCCAAPACTPLPCSPGVPSERTAMSSPGSPVRRPLPPFLLCSDVPAPHLR